MSLLVLHTKNIQQILSTINNIKIPFFWKFHFGLLKIFLRLTSYQRSKSWLLKSPFLSLFSFWFNFQQIWLNEILLMRDSFLSFSPGSLYQSRWKALIRIELKFTGACHSIIMKRPYWKSMGTWNRLSDSWRW